MEYKAWLCIAGAILINLTLGTFYSIGNVAPYIASYMRNNGNPNVRSEDATWLTAAFLLGQGVFIMIGSIVEQKFNSRVACIIGCTIHCLSTFLTIFALKMNFVALVLVYGLGSGIGCGSSYMASIIAAQKWFPNRKGLLTGIIVSGFGLGGLVFTKLETLYVNPNNVEPDSSRYFPANVYNRVPNLFLYMGIVFTIAQGIGCLIAFPPPEHQVEPRSNQSNQTGNTTINEEVLPTIKSFKQVFGFRIFYVIGLMMMLVASGVTFANSLGKSYGQAFIKDDNYLSTVIGVASIANALGRLTWGYLMEKFSFTKCFTAKVILFTSLVATFSFKFILSSKVLLMIWMLGMFFGFSGTFVLFPVFIEQVFGAKYFGLTYGILYVFLAIASILMSLLVSLVSPTSAGNPDNELISRLTPCLVVAALYISSLVIYCFVLPTRKIDKAIQRKLEQESTMSRDSLANRQDLLPIERSSLAEKTSSIGNDPNKEYSLGSIVRFKQASGVGGNIKVFNR